MKSLLISGRLPPEVANLLSIGRMSQRRQLDKVVSLNFGISFSGSKIIPLNLYPISFWYLRLIERSEEHTSELQSRGHLVCRLLLEQKTKHYTGKRQRTEAGVSGSRI